MSDQLELLEPGEHGEPGEPGEAGDGRRGRSWELDAQTREIGLRGVALARQALRQATSTRAAA
jgi:hypothetical protein